MFSQSKILQELPEQFFASLVAKVNAKVAEGYDVINLGQGMAVVDNASNENNENTRRKATVVPIKIEYV